MTTRKTTFELLAALLAASAFAGDPIDIGGSLQVMWDDYIVDTNATTAARVQQKPEYAGDVLTFDRPWEDESCNYPTIFRDGEKWRMYYRASCGNTNCAPGFGIVCLAESSDGLVWTRPNLGVCRFAGSTENNIVVDGTVNECLDNFFVMKDPNPACPKEELYKGVGSYERWYVEGEKLPACYETFVQASTELETGKTRKVIRGLCLYTSPDGIRFKCARPIATYGAFDSLNTLHWDARRQVYVCYMRGYHAVYGDRNGDNSVRDVLMTLSPDSVCWSAPSHLRFGPDAEDYALYTNGMQKYFRNDRLWIGLPTRYVERKKWTKNYDRLPDVAARRERMGTSPWTQRSGLAITDAVFMMSRDGLNFERSDEAFLRPGPQMHRNWIYGDCYPAVGMIPTKGRDGASEELSIYVTRGHWAMKPRRPTTLERYRLRMDGFFSRNAPYRGAKVVTKPLVFRGTELLINFSTSARGRLFVTVTAEDGTTLRSIELFGDEVDRVVDFETDALGAFAGKPVTLTFEMSDADLYSFRFRAP